MTRNVLIVEDEQELAKILKRHLEDLSCTVQLAFAGDVGLRLAESRSCATPADSSSRPSLA
jgi:DNA-binding response OmpR family regulator